NMLDVEGTLPHLDGLVYGTGFAIVGAGGDGEPDALITLESPFHVTTIRNPRTRRTAAGYARQLDDDGEEVGFTLYLPNETVWVDSSGIVLDYDWHGLGRVPVVPFPNRIRSDRLGGRSEITKAVRSLTEGAVRTLLGVEVHREFYQAPQWHVVGASQDQFVDDNGNPISGWEAVMGRILALDFNEDTGQKPEIGQFQAASPAPYFEQIKGYAQLLAAEAAIPATYLGFVHDNPTSADAIRTAEARLVKRAERRQKVFGAAWLEVARLALLIRDGELPDDFNEVRTAWRDPSTPTRAAATDATVKLVQTGVLPVDSDVTLDQLGFSETDKQRLVQDRRKAQAAASLAALSAVPPARVPGGEPDAGDGGVPPAPGGPAPSTPPQGPTAPADEADEAGSDEADPDVLRKKFDALGIAIRAGVSPASALRLLGLEGVEMTGAVPVSLRMPEGEADGLEQK